MVALFNASTDSEERVCALCDVTGNIKHPTSIDGKVKTTLN